MERLQKILAQAGIASRRKCEELILSGQVEVNGVQVKTLGAKADPNEDVITVNGKPIETEAKLYIMLNKPKGVITSASDPQGRKVVSDFLSGIKQRVYPIGRLDYDTEGLLLLTNDGEFANLLTHPKHHVPKTYLATVDGVPHGEKLDQLRKGVELEDGMTAPAEVEYQDIQADNKESTIRITIYEGRNRQVRRMFDAVGHPVTRLKRVKFGEIGLQNLKRGGWRPLTPKEVAELRAEAAKAEGKENPIASSRNGKKPEWKPKPKPKGLATASVSEASEGRKPAKAKPSTRTANGRSRKSYAEAVIEKVIGSYDKNAGSADGRRPGDRQQQAGSQGRSPRGRAAAGTQRDAARNTQTSNAGRRPKQSETGRSSGRSQDSRGRGQTPRSGDRPGATGGSRPTRTRKG
ncbi:pseudouridine synthase [Paenibacillus sp. PR3]|uniref:Pseudouridine synthase n=1 Tax=Paenibacillus terricola TaxID=2763503 RepID=A0ABR8MRZ1_9BACL|nr:pseudouridine synthase [Paenibacillus terricola]